MIDYFFVNVQNKTLILLYGTDTEHMARAILTWSRMNRTKASEKQDRYEILLLRLLRQLNTEWLKMCI